MLYDRLEELYNIHKENSDTCTKLMLNEAFSDLQKHADEIVRTSKGTMKELSGTAIRGNNAVNLFTTKMGLPKDIYKRYVIEIFPDFGESLF